MVANLFTVKIYYSYYKRLTKMIDLKMSKLEFNTNGSIFPKKDILELLLKAKSVELEFSIDAVGELAEVTRYGVSGKQLNKQLKNGKLIFQCCFFHTSLSLLNLSKLNELKEWIHESGFYMTAGLGTFLHRQAFINVYPIVNEHKQALIGDMSDFPGKDKLYDELMFEGLGNPKQL